MVKTKGNYNRKRIFPMIVSIILILFFILISSISNGYDIKAIEKGEHIIAAYREYGNGSCIFYSDAETFNNRGLGNKWDHWSNKEVDGAKQLTLNILSWLGKGGNKLLIDQKHCELSPDDKGYFGIMGLTEFLINSHYEVNYSTGGGDLSYELLSNYDVVLLLDIYDLDTTEETLENYSFSENEISNITNYVSNGGGLFVLCSGENVGCGASNDLYNPILKMFNAEFNSNLLEAQNNYIRFKLKFHDHTVNNNVKDLPLVFPCSISITNQTKPLIHFIFKNPEESSISSFDFSIILLAVIIIIGIYKKR